MLVPSSTENWRDPPDLHIEQVLLSWREKVAIAIGKRSWVRVAA